ncbi:MAG TPA: MerR family transcriptional regulator [Actinomycetota bacterium]|nr:MerR family transcriptional regulator [Actinomycetota bacterium]
MERQWRVGELAEATGLTVRTLHHYDDAGLLKPGARTPAGHRLYSGRDVARLYSIVALRGLGFSLAEIGTLLDGDGVDPREATRRRLAELDRQMGAQQRLRRRLVALLGAMDGGEDASPERLIELVEEMTMHEKYYTPEQLAQLERRREELGGDDAMARAEREWAELIAAVRAEKERGTAPSDPRMQELADRWTSLIEQFTGGDPEIARSLKTMYESEGPEKASRGMVDADLMAYAQKAIEARGRGA